MIGALVIKKSDGGKSASEAVNAARRLRKLLFSEEELRNSVTMGAVGDSSTGDVQFFVSRSEKPTEIETVDFVVYDDNPEKYVWERGCLLRCQLPIKFPFYYPVNGTSGEFLYSFISN